MSDFDLVPVDGGDPVRLPPGEAVLGRGPFLGVGDRRISRNHALLENLNGQLRLKPTHLNPCFVQSSPTDDPRPLQRNSWYPLHHGDLFSLLPGQFIYKVVAVGEEDRTPKNSQMFEEELPVSPQPDVERSPPPIGQDPGPPPPQEQPERAARSNQEDANSWPKSSDKAEFDSPTEARGDHRNPPSVTRSRVLPAWMMAAVGASPSALKVQSPLKRSKGPAAASTSTKRAAAKQATPAEISSPEEAELSTEEQPKKRRRKMNDQSNTDVPPKTESNRPEVSDESDGFIMEVDEEGGGGETSTADMSTGTQTYELSKSEKEERNGGQASKGAESNSSCAPSKPRLRTPCPYGKDCYRKNPVHFQECSHPGDTDHEEEEETEEADLPECPYGTDCYRKNPLHRKEYKHTRKPASMTRTRPRKARAYDDDEDEEGDSGDEDSFINDDSEEAGDDSDYVPPVSDDSEEDVRALQKEAEALLRKRK